MHSPAACGPASLAPLAPGAYPSSPTEIGLRQTIIYFECERSRAKASVSRRRQSGKRPGSRFAATRLAALRNSQVRAIGSLRFLGDKEFLGGNSVRAVAHPAPQRQLE